MANPLAQAAVKGVKPWLSDDAWARLVRLDPSTTRREQRAKRLQREEAAQRKADHRASERAQTLPQLARQFGTDKWGIHRYAQHYERHLGPLKDASFNLLEIGIGGYAREGQGGASLRMWKAFFPKAQVIGLDIEDKSFVNEPRILAYQGSQVDEPLLHRIVEQSGPFRVIIDDGSHRPEHLRETFGILFPLLEDGGFYALEDVQTSYWPKWGGSMDIKDPSRSMGMVKDLLDGLNYEEWQRDGYEPSYTDLHVVAIHCYHNLIIIEKGTNAEGTNRNPNWDKVS